MLNSEQYVALSEHLNSISHIVPYKWGRMQEKDLDRKLPKLYDYETFDDLNAGIENNITKGFIEDSENSKNYYRHRWFVYKCSLVDEYLFCALPNVDAAQEKDPWRDFSFKNKFGLDLKGTVLLKQYKDDPDYVLRNPLALIDSFYKEQSQDFHYRRRLQNRLFLVHHSYVSPSQEPFLRTSFEAKKFVFAEYAKLMQNPDHKIFEYMYGRKSDVIFIFEKADGSLHYGIGSENLKGEVTLKPINI